MSVQLSHCSSPQHKAVHMRGQLVQAVSVTLPHVSRQAQVACVNKVSDQISFSDCACAITQRSAAVLNLTSEPVKHLTLFHFLPSHNDQLRAVQS